VGHHLEIIRLLKKLDDRLHYFIEVFFQICSTSLPEYINFVAHYIVKFLRFRDEKD